MSLWRTLLHRASIFLGLTDRTSDQNLVPTITPSVPELDLVNSEFERASFEEYEIFSEPNNMTQHDVEHAHTSSIPAHIQASEEWNLADRPDRHWIDASESSSQGVLSTSKPERFQNEEDQGEENQPQDVSFTQPSNNPSLPEASSSSLEPVQADDVQVERQPAGFHELPLNRPKRSSAKPAIPRMKMSGLRRLDKKGHQHARQSQSTRPILSRNTIREGARSLSSSVSRQANQHPPRHPDRARVHELERHIAQRPIGPSHDQQSTVSHLREVSTHDEAVSQELPPPSSEPLSFPERSMTEPVPERRPRRKENKSRSASHSVPHPTEELLTLMGETNQELNDFARARYIDYDEVLTSHARKDEEE